MKVHRAVLSLCVPATMATAACVEPVDGEASLAAASEPLTTSEVIQKPSIASIDTARVWNWITVAGTRCGQSDAPTGIVVNRASTTAAPTGLVIYLSGGGACWNAATCLAGLAKNMDGFGPADWDAVQTTEEGTEPAPSYFSRNPGDPFENYDMVFVSYCTGDLHAGARSTLTTVSPPVVFAGNDNYKAMLAEVAKFYTPTLMKGKRVLLAGSSAGGFGATWHFERTVDTFNPSRPSITTPVDLLVDSAPPFGADVLTPTQYGMWNAAWKLGSVVYRPSVGIRHDAIFDNAVRTFSGSRFAVQTSVSDIPVRIFAGTGQPVENLEGGMLQEEIFQDGLANLYARMPTAANLNMFFVDGLGADESSDGVDYQTFHAFWQTSPANTDVRVSGTAYDGTLRHSDWVRGLLKVPGYSWADAIPSWL